MKNIWAIGDLHLSFGVANKKMDIFGPHWADHAEKIQQHWTQHVKTDDLVLIPGDISWAMRLEDAVADLKWIDALPGTKVMIRGNHDYWWSSLNKIAQVLPPSIHLVQNNVFKWNDLEVAGARLWDTHEYGFDSVIERMERIKPAMEKTAEPTSAEEEERIFQRELQRLETSLKALSPKAKIRLAMTHYPPIGLDLKPTRASRLLSQYGVQICVFGHLHNVRRGAAPFGESEGVKYMLTSCDYLDFQLLKLSEQGT